MPGFSSSPRRFSLLPAQAPLAPRLGAPRDLGGAENRGPRLRTQREPRGKAGPRACAFPSRFWSSLGTRGALTNVSGPVHRASSPRVHLPRPEPRLGPRGGGVHGHPPVLHLTAAPRSPGRRPRRWPLCSRSKDDDYRFSKKLFQSERRFLCSFRKYFKGSCFNQ